jgi:DNA repair photolyase
MINKHHFHYNGKTGIATTEGFKHKLLADYSMNIGNICEFGCTFCYVPSVTNKQKTVLDILDKGYKVDEFSSYRYRENVLETVATDLKKISSNDQGTVIFCTTCDPCATQEHADTTIGAIKLIMTRSNLRVRVLSKSILINNIAESIPEYKDRVMYSLSTGTISEDISKAIEGNASLISARVKALHWLQDNGYRTYGMICPVIPSEVKGVSKLLDQVRPQLCEYVWAEAINVRGKSLINTYNKLKVSGLENDADELKRVMESKLNWNTYSVTLFKNFQEEMHNRGLLDKLRFLQYMNPEIEKHFRDQPGAVCL